MGNFFYNMWMNATDKLNDFNPIDISWKDHPQYKYNPSYEKLYADLRAKDSNYDVNRFEQSMKKNVGIKRWNQEYECEFLGTGDTYIDGETLTLLNNNTSREFWIKYNNRMRVWKEPEAQYYYCMGIDVAMGRERDYSAFHVINAYDGEQVAEFYSNRTPLDEFAQIIAETGKFYNNALVVPERNTIGNNLIENLIRVQEYENIWMDKNALFGFQTTLQTKAQILAVLEDFVRNKKVRLNSERTIKELLTFIIDDTGKAKADEGQNDDLVISLALTCFGLNEVLINTPGVLSKIIGNNLTDPMGIMGSQQAVKRPEWGGKTYDEIKWVLGN
jgi:hypothetical protein